VDVGRIGNTSGERLDYPTQKPEELLERIIKVSSNPGDLVFDCFMGSGTTQAVALKLGRKFIGCDINLGAIQTTTKRLIGLERELSSQLQENTIFGGFSVYNVNNYDVFRNPVQAKELLIEALEIQPLPSNSLYDGEKDGRMVKIMPVNRISTKADLGPLITGFDYKAFQKKQEDRPNKPVESILLVCMGHEPDLAAHLKRECHGFELDVEVVDILRDKSNIEFKRDSEAEITIAKGILKIEAFYPMNLLQKLSIQKEKIEDWRELTESVMIDWNYDGGVFEPATVDVPDKDALVDGTYKVPKDAGTIRIKITDLLSESLEMEVTHG
jgi:site-specific DNA-methyltransferase (adenine-specific)/adenine-specific DNA-methyltransferase